MIRVINFIESRGKKIVELSIEEYQDLLNRLDTLEGKKPEPQDDKLELWKPEDNCGYWYINSSNLGGNAPFDARLPE